MNTFFEEQIYVVFITLCTEVGINIIISQSSVTTVTTKCFNQVTHEYSSKKRCLSSLSLVKTNMGYFTIGAPTSEGSVLAL